jgi:hypothetical protein
MKLYTNDNGEWFGTQALAKQRSYHWWPVDVPTDKPSLIEWLNYNSVTSKTSIKFDENAMAVHPKVEASHTSNDKKHPWQSVREMAEQASLRDLGVALAVVMNRLEEAAEREELS